MEIKKSRNSSIELLRIVSIFFVLVGHTFGHGAHGEVPNAGYILAFGISINVFMLISGYYGIKLRIKSFMGMVGMVMFYSIASTAVTYFLTGGGNLNGALSGLLPISHNYYYWFASCYFFLMMLSPLLNKGLASLSDRQYIWVVIGIIYMNCVSGWLMRNYFINSTGFSTMQLIFMYVLGNAVRRLKWAEIISMRWLVVIYFATSIFSMADGKIPYINTLGGYNNPVDVVKSVAVFCIFMKLTISSQWINRVSSCVFACYLLQEGALGLELYKVQYATWQSIQSAPKFWLYALGCVAMIFAVAIVLEPIRKKWMDRLIDKLYTRFDLDKIDITNE